MISRFFFFFFFFDNPFQGLAISLLFHHEGGILAFLHKLPDSKAVEDAKTVLLQFLAKFIEKNPNDTQDYFLDLKVTPALPFTLMVN